MLAILSSMPFESDLVLSCMEGVRRKTLAGKTVCRGNLSGHEVLLMNTGIGKVNAAHSATCILEAYRVRKIMNIGVGGAYPEAGLEVGDVALAVKEILGDEGVIGPQGWGSYREIGIPLVQAGRKKYFNEFPMSVPGRKDMKMKTGSFVTVSAATGTRARARELEERFGAVCENMEGAAIAQVCAIYKVPMIEIRGISNIAGVRDKSKWDLKLASQNCQKAVLERAAALF